MIPRTQVYRGHIAAPPPLSLPTLNALNLGSHFLTVHEHNNRLYMGKLGERMGTIGRFVLDGTAWCDSPP